MEISKAEYKLLKKISRNKELAINNEISDALLSKGLVKSDFDCMPLDCVFDKPDKLKLTNAGIVAYENYRSHTLSVRRANIQSWIAIGISTGSLAVSLISLLRG